MPLPPLSYRLLPSTRLLLEGRPTLPGTPLDVSAMPIPPPLLSSRKLLLTTLSLAPSMVMPSPAVEMTSLRSIRFPLTRSRKTPCLLLRREAVVADEVVRGAVRDPDADVVDEDVDEADGVAVDVGVVVRGRRRRLRERRVDRRRVPEHDGRFLALLDRHVLDDVPRRALVEHDAVVELLDFAAADGHVVEAVVADAGADALAVDDVAVEVDRDAGLADDEPVVETVGEVVLDDDALRQDLAAEDVPLDGRVGDVPDVLGRLSDRSRSCRSRARRTFARPARAEPQPGSPRPSGYVLGDVQSEKSYVTPCPRSEHS